MTALRVSAVLTWLVSVGFGGPTPFVASRLLRTGELPWFRELFPMYAGPFFDRCSHSVFVVLLAVFATVCTADAFAGWLVWSGMRAGAWMMIALLGVELIFWIGFALPIPPAIAVLRFGALIWGWASLT